MEACCTTEPRVDIGLILSKLEKVKKAGRGWTAQCPGPLHQQGDRHPSLSIAQATGGRVLLHCWAGCTFEQIVAALGFEPGDLSPGRPRPTTPAERWAAAEWARRREEERAVKEWAEKAYLKLCAIRRLFDRSLIRPQETDSKVYTKISYFDSVLDELQHGNAEALLSVLRAARAGRLGLAGAVVV